ncbi:MAG: TadE family protein, partial [Vicinamibacterales bacterium]
MSLLQRWCRRIRGDQGANLLEAAIALPLVILLTFSVVDFASMFYVYLALENGVSQGTRFGVTGNVMNDPNTGDPMSRQDSIIAATRDATPTLDLPDADFSFQHLTTGSSSWAAGVGGPSDIVKVTVNYDWDILTPVL